MEKTTIFTINDNFLSNLKEHLGNKIEKLEKKYGMYISNLGEKSEFVNFVLNEIELTSTFDTIKVTIGTESYFLDFFLNGKEVLELAVER